MVKNLEIENLRSLKNRRQKAGRRTKIINGQHKKRKKLIDLKSNDRICC